jgi:hypothetical protein
VEALAGRAGTASLPVGVVLATHFEPGATWVPRPLARADALMCLIDNTVTVRAQPGVALDHLTLALADAVALGGPRGEASDTASALTAWLQHLGSPGPAR